MQNDDSRSSHTAATVVDVVISTSLAPFLSRLGFKKEQRRIFVRKIRHDIVQRIAFQLVRAKSDPELNIYLGIGYEALRPIEAKWRGISPAEASSSQLGDSIGYIAPPFRFRSLPVVSAEQLVEVCLYELTNYVLPFLERYSDLSAAVECWDGDFPYGRVNARIFGPFGRLASGDIEGSVRSANAHLRRLMDMGADPDLIDEQRRLAAFVRSYSSSADG